MEGLPLRPGWGQRPDSEVCLLHSAGTYSGGDHHQAPRDLFDAQAVGTQKLVETGAWRRTPRLGLDPHRIPDDAAGEDDGKPGGLKGLERLFQAETAEGAALPGGGRRHQEPDHEGAYEHSGLHRFAKDLQAARVDPNGLA